MPRGLAAAGVVQRPKAPWIIKGDDCTVIEGQDDMIMRGCRARGVAGGDSPRHAEMEEQQSVGVEFDQNVFAAATERPDFGAVEAFGEFRRKRPPQVRPTQFGLYNPTAAHFQRQPAPHGFDLRQLGHSRRRYSSKNRFLSSRPPAAAALDPPCANSRIPPSTLIGTGTR